MGALEELLSYKPYGWLALRGWEEESGGGEEEAEEEYRDDEDDALMEVTRLNGIKGRGAREIWEMLCMYGESLHLNDVQIGWRRKNKNVCLIDSE